MFNHLTHHVAGCLGSALLVLVPVASATNFDVYVLAGQSNADGRGRVSQLSGDLAAAQPDHLIHYSNPGSAEDPSQLAYDTGWQTLAPGFSVPPGHEPRSLPSRTFGPEVSFASAISEATATENPIALIKIAQGGTNLYSDWSPTGYLYQTLLQQVDRAFAEMADQGDAGTIRGMLWHQGESDTSEPFRSRYQDNLIELVGNVREEWAVADLPFVIGELEQGHDAEFREIQRQISLTDANIGFVSSVGLITSDGTHFDAASQIVLGQRFAQETARLLPEPSGLMLISLSACMLGRRRATLVDRGVV